jgi:hypothetical protein
MSPGISGEGGIEDGNAFSSHEIDDQLAASALLSG